jgi:hypothetical protein
VPPNPIAAGCTAITPELLPLARLTQGEIDTIVASVPGGAANVQDVYPLSPLQEGILFHHLLDDSGDTYCCAPCWRSTTAPVSTPSWRAAPVIARHDVLRTAIRWTGLAEPVQVVLRAAPLPLAELDAGASRPSTTCWPPPIRAAPAWISRARR